MPNAKATQTATTTTKLIRETFVKLSARSPIPFVGADYMVGWEADLCLHRRYDKGGRQIADTIRVLHRVVPIGFRRTGYTERLRGSIGDLSRRWASVCPTDPFRSVPFLSIALYIQAYGSSALYSSIWLAA